MMNVYTTAEDRARRRRLVITALTLMAIVIAIVMTIGLAWSPMGSSDSGPTEWSSSGTLPAAAVTGAPEDRARVDSFAERTSTAAGRSDHTNVHEPLIHGVVCNPSGRPVAGLRVVCRGLADDRTLGETASDADGGFRLPVPPTSAYRIGVESPSWTTLLEPRSLGSPPLVEVALVVAPTALLQGVVVDASGAPVADAAISMRVSAPLREHAPRTASRSDDVVWRVRADVSGAFSFAHAPEIEVVIQARSRSHGEVSSKVTPPFSGMRLQFPQDHHAAMLEGIVRLPQGISPENAVVTLGESATRVDGQGSFHIDLRKVTLLPNQRPILRAGCSGYVPVAIVASGTNWRQRSAWPADIVLEMHEPAMQITGVTLDARGSPIACEVDVVDRLPWPEQRVPPKSLLAVANPNEAVGSEGAFCVSRLSKGSHRLRVMVVATQQVHITEPIEAGSAGHRIALPDCELWPPMAVEAVDREGSPVGHVQWRLEGPPPAAGGGRVEGPLQQAAADGIIHLTRIASTMDTLVVGAGGGAPLRRWPLHVLQGSTDRRLQVPRMVDVVIEIRAASPTIDGASLVDAEGRECRLIVTTGTMAESVTRVRLVEGRTQPFRCPDDAAAVVLLAGGREAWRTPLALDLHGTNVVRP